METVCGQSSLNYESDSEDSNYEDEDILTKIVPPESE